MVEQTAQEQQQAAYDWFLRQLYEATTGILLAGAVATGDTRPATAKTWVELTGYDREHLNVHVMPVLRDLGAAVYCVNGWETT